MIKIQTLHIKGAIAAWRDFRQLVGFSLKYSLGPLLNSFGECNDLVSVCSCCRVYAEWAGALSCGIFFILLSQSIQTHRYYSWTCFALRCNFQTFPFFSPAALLSYTQINEKRVTCTCSPTEMHLLCCVIVSLFTHESGGCRTLMQPTSCRELILVAGMIAMIYVFVLSHFLHLVAN